MAAERVERPVELRDDEIDPSERLAFEFLEVFAELVASLVHCANGSVLQIEIRAGLVTDTSRPSGRSGARASSGDAMRWRRA